MMWSQEEDADESKELQKKKKQVWHPEKSKRKPVTFSRSDIRSWHWSWNHMDSHCCLQVITSIATCIGERPEMNLKLQNSGVPASQIMSWSKDADHKSQAQTCKHFAQSIGATPLEGMTGWWRLWPKIWITVHTHCVVVARPWRVRLTKLRCPSTADLIESNICNDGDGDGDDFQRFTDQFLPVLSLLVQQHHRASQGSFRKHLFWRSFSIPGHVPTCATSWIQRQRIWSCSQTNAFSCQPSIDPAQEVPLE